MKKIILVVATLTFTLTSCKKKTATVTPTTVYCMYTGETIVNEFIGCGTKEEAQQKAIEMRDQGKRFTATEKSSCSECK